MARLDALDLAQLRRQARGLQSRDPSALARLSIVDAQRLVARGHGFPNWSRLRAHVDAVARWTVDPRRSVSHGAGDDLLLDACLTFSERDAARPWGDVRARLTPDLLGSVHLAAAAGDVAAVRAALAVEPAAATRRGGPHQWEPLLYLAYSRMGGGDPVGVARALLERGADPNAGFMTDGAPPPYTVLAGVFGGSAPDQPPHPEARALAEVLLVAGADANDARVLFNRQDDPDDEHLAQLVRHGLGSPGATAWERRLGAYAAAGSWSAKTAGWSGPTLLAQQIAHAEQRGFGMRVTRLRIARLRL